MPPQKSNPPAPGTFGAALQMHRERCKMTQGEMCALFPGLLPSRTWQHYESGTRIPPQWIQQLIIDKLSKTKPKKS